MHFYVANAIERVLEHLPETNDTENFGDRVRTTAVLTRLLSSSLWQFYEKRSSVLQNVSNHAEAHFKKVYKEDKEESKRLARIIVNKISSHAKYVLQKWLDEATVYPWDALDIPQESIYFSFMGYMLNKVPKVPHFISVFDCDDKLNIRLSALCSEVHKNKASNQNDDEDSASSGGDE